MSLRDIFCQDKAIKILQSSLACDKLAHAWIFAGTEGVGKYKTAYEWSKLLLCENPVKEKDFADSCGKCESCRLFDAGSHPDFGHVRKELLEFTKDGKGKKTPINLPIDVIREFLIAPTATKPVVSKRKVFVVSESEKLNRFSQNALLKILEEPPGYCSIFMLCTRLEKLLPTIKSRCQLIRFGPVTEERIINHLEQSDIDNRIAQYFARLSQGSIGRACQWAKLEAAGAELYSKKRELLNSFVNYQLGDSVELAERFLAESKKLSGIWAELDKDTSKADINRRALKTFVEFIISALHDGMKLKADPTERIVNSDQKNQIEELMQHFDAEQLAVKVTQAHKILRWIDASVNEKLIFEQLLLELALSDTI